SPSRGVQCRSEGWLCRCLARAPWSQFRQRLTATSRGAGALLHGTPQNSNRMDRADWHVVALGRSGPLHLEVSVGRPPFGMPDGGSFELGRQGVFVLEAVNKDSR